MIRNDRDFRTFVQMTEDAAETVNAGWIFPWSIFGPDVRVTVHNEAPRLIADKEGPNYTKTLAASFVVVRPGYDMSGLERGHFLDAIASCAKCIADAVKAAGRDAVNLAIADVYGGVRSRFRKMTAGMPLTFAMLYDERRGQDMLHCACHFWFDAVASKPAPEPIPGPTLAKRAPARSADDIRADAMDAALADVVACIRGGGDLNRQGSLDGSRPAVAEPVTNPHKFAMDNSLE